MSKKGSLIQVFFKNLSITGTIKATSTADIEGILSVNGAKFNVVAADVISIKHAGVSVVHASCS